MNYNELTKAQIKQIKKLMLNEFGFLSTFNQLRQAKKENNLSYTAVGDYAFDLGFHK